MDLNGTSAIVTGGASGLGDATSRLLAERGVRVVVADLQEDKGAPLAKEIGGLFVPTDVTKPEQVIAAVDAAVEMAPLKSLVNCAGIGWATRTIGRDGDYAVGPRPRPVPPGHRDQPHRDLQLHPAGGHEDEPQRARLRRRPRCHREHVVGGGRGRADRAGGLLLVQGRRGGVDAPVARDLAVVGIRVNTILPGLIDTPIYGAGEGSETFKGKLAQDVLFPHRLGYSTEFASLAVELLSNSYINAESIRIDAGIRMQPK